MRDSVKGSRAELHGRFADWLEVRSGGAIEHDEMIGWHLEQAHQHLRELGPTDEHGRAFGARAARYLAAAGKRALARDDLPLAASLLGRALNQLDAADLARADLALDWCEALLASGDVGPAAHAIDELARFIDGSDRLRAWHTCFAGQLAVLTDPQALRTTADAVSVAAEELASIGDAAGEAKAHSVHALALQRLGKIGACEVALDCALAAARRAHDRRRASAVLAGAPLAALWGPSPVTRASGRCLDVVRVLRITQGAPAVEAVALRCQGVIEALRGRTAAARRMIASSRRMVEELGITQRLLEADVFAGHVELLDGDAAAAERCLRVAYDGLRNHGLRIDAAQAAALLGRALLAQDRAQEAEALSHDSEALAGDDLKAAIAWRGVRAEAIARRGEHLAAVEFARAAVDIAATTDALLDHADARRTLASVLHAAGRNDEGAIEEAHAIELWETKGATLLAERARGDTSRPPAAATRPSNDRPQAGRTALHRVRPNAATANAARLDAAIAARDEDALPALLADTVEIVHHPTGVAYDRHAGLAAWHTLLRARDLCFAHEPVATLGDSLALFRTSVSFSALPDSDAGAASWDEVILIEVDSRGQRRRVELFTADKLGSAITRLYERYADCLPKEPARAAATARAMGALLGPLDIDRYGTAIAPGVEFVDRRTVGFPSGHGVEELLRSIRTLYEISDDPAVRVDDVLALRSDALLVRWTTSGTDRVNQGAFEWQFLRLCIFGADGLLKRAEQFDCDHEAEALARFDELALSTAEELTVKASAGRFTNSAFRAVQRFECCWRERDWNGVVATFAPAHVMDDRRVLMRTRLEGEAYFASLRSVFDAMTSSRWEFVLLATRGERLALLRVEIAGAARGSGPLVRELFWIVEVDPGDRRVALVTFDLDALDAAYAELDERYTAIEAASSRRTTPTRAFTRAFAARDWGALAALLAPDLVVNDHRLLGWETLHGPAGYIQALKALADLAPDVHLRIDHVSMSAPRLLYATTWVGTHEGGPFESPSVILCELDGIGRICRFDQYDLDQLDEVRRRFAEPGSEPPFGGRVKRMISLAVARRMALSLPEVTEQDHHGMPSFRVQGKIFTTAPDARHLHVMLDAFVTHAAVGAYPDACEELWWGRRLSGVRVNLDHADHDLLADLLDAAWRRRAPKPLREAYKQERPGRQRT